jgi:hypothetical protein
MPEGAGAWTARPALILAWCAARPRRRRRADGPKGAGIITAGTPVPGGERRDVAQGRFAVLESRFTTSTTCSRGGTSRAARAGGVGGKTGETTPVLLVRIGFDTTAAAT